MNKLLLAVLLTLGLTSCAEYESRYTPPTTSFGRECVQSCLAQKSACKQNCNNRHMISDLTSTVGQTLAKSSKNKDANSSLNSNFPRSSSSDDCGCQSDYENCYKSCGGEIRKVCIANCGK